MKKFWIIVIVIVVVIIGAYLLLNTKNNSSKVVKVGISKMISQPIIDEVEAGVVSGFAKAGFIEGKNIVFDFNNAQGDASINQAIAQKLANSNFDIFIPLGTQASQAVVNLIKDRPIVFGVVTNPLAAGIVKSNKNPGGNVTGISNIALIKEQLELLKKLVPNAKTIGLLYNPGEVNSVAGLEKTKNYSKEFGLEFIVAPVNNTNEILSAARSIVDKVDAFYIMPDNTVVTGQESLIKVAIEAKKPLIAIDQSGVQKGALATFSTNYTRVGELTAEIAVRVLKGEKPGDIPVLEITEGNIFLNKTTAKAIGIDIPVELIKQAKQVY